MLPPRKKSSKAQRQEHDLCQPSGDQPGWGLRNQVLEEGAREKAPKRETERSSKSRLAFKSCYVTALKLKAAKCSSEATRM